MPVQCSFGLRRCIHVALEGYAMKHDEHMVSDFGFCVFVALLVFAIGAFLYATYRVLT